MLQVIKLQVEHLTELLPCDLCDTLSAPYCIDVLAPEFDNCLFTCEACLFEYSATVVSTK